jgi:peptidase M28-like protein
MRRALIVVVLLLSCVLALHVVGLAQNGGIVTDPDITAIVNSISPDHIQATSLAMQNFFTRNSCSDTVGPGQGVTPARDYLVSRYSALQGLQVQLDPFTHPNCSTKPTYNVLAWIPGARFPNQLVIVGGHYDSRTVNVLDTTSYAPGGNDSGGQTGVVLEIANSFVGHSFDSTVVFMSFSGEEQGLYGSAEIAANLSKYFPNPQVIAMLNTDIPGGDVFANRGDDFQHFRLYSSGIPPERLSTDPDGTTDNTSPSRGVMRYVGTWGGAYVPNFVMKPILREDRPGRGSDHISFVNQGFPGVRIMETFECSPSPVDNSCGGPYPCPPPPFVQASCLSLTTDHQHDGTDLNQFITPPYAANIARVIASVAASLARAPGAPQNFNAVGNAVQGVHVSFQAPTFGTVDHYVVAARAVSQNSYQQRIPIQIGTAQALISPAQLGLTSGDSFFISVASVDAKGHESLFAYPELRCDSTQCVVVP